LSNVDFKTTKQPGWDNHSFGYSSNGKIYYKGRENGRPYGPFFEDGDIIGCGMNYIKKEIFFTKNGKYLGPGFLNISKKLYPTISTNVKGYAIKIEFEDFKFNILELIKQETSKISGEIEASYIPHDCLNELIQDYLYFNGFQKTLSKFENTSMLKKKLENEQDLKFRNELKEFIMNGDILKTIQILNEKHMNFLNEFKFLRVKLFCQVFIELIRKDEIFQAIDFSKGNMNEFEDLLNDSFDKTWSTSDSKNVQTLIFDTLGSLSYENPIDSSVGYLFEISKRETLFEDLNRNLLEFLKKPKSSKLEMIQQHLFQINRKFGDDCTGVEEIMKNLM
jgi:Ran-binding protein 9/10